MKKMFYLTIGLIIIFAGCTVGSFGPSGSSHDVGDNRSDDGIINYDEPVLDDPVYSDTGFSGSNLSATARLDTAAGGDWTITVEGVNLTGTVPGTGSSTMDIVGDGSTATVIATPSAVITTSPIGTDKLLLSIDWDNLDEIGTVCRLTMVVKVGSIFKLGTVSFDEIQPVINVRQNITVITNRGTYDFGNVVSGQSLQKTFTIENTGNAELNLTGDPKALIYYYHASMFNVDTQPSSPVGESQSTTFTITFNPEGEGEKYTWVSIPNDDADENSFRFKITGNSLYEDDIWESVEPPTDCIALEIDAQNEIIFVRSGGNLYRSTNVGETWTEILSGADIISSRSIGNIGDIETDSGNLYIAGGNGVLLSDNNGDTFRWSYYWSWDPNHNVDFNNGVGWTSISGFGSRSGPNRKITFWELRKGDIPYDRRSIISVIADVIDPENIAYIADRYGYNKRTINGGINWLACGRVYFCDERNGNSIAYSSSQYSEDYGETWLALGIYATVYAKDTISRKLFAGYRGVYVNEESQPQDQWTDYGLTGVSLSSLAVCNTSGQDYVFAVSSSGNIYRAEF